jgi:hypothetical protein
VYYNNAVQSLATTIYVSHLTDDNIDIEVFFVNLSQLNEVYIQQKTLSENFIRYNITGLPTITTGSNVSIPVSSTSFGGTGQTSFGVNEPIVLSFFTNTIETDTRITALETKTQNQSAVLNTTTLNGDLNMSGNKITVLGEPTLSTDAATKAYVDDVVADVGTVSLKWGTFMISFYLVTSTPTLITTSAYMPITGLSSIGGSSALVTQEVTPTLSKIFKILNNTSTVADGQKSGYICTTLFPKIYPKIGFIYNVAFGIGDTNITTAAVTQMLFGIGISTTVPLFSSTLGPNTTPSIMGIGHDVGDTVLSWYYRGTGGGQKIATTFVTTTPSAYWFNLNIYNPMNSNSVFFTLTDDISGLTSTQTFTFSDVSTPDSIIQTSLLFPVHTRAMGVLGGTTGAAKTFFSRFKLSLK